MIVDTHVHISGQPGADVATYEATRPTLGVDAAVVVQYLASFENQRVLEAHRAMPARYRGVGRVDPAAPDALRHIDDLACTPGMVGVRMPAPEPGTLRQVQATWLRAADRGLLVSVAGPFEAVVDERFAAFVVDNAIPVKYEHLGWLRFGDRAAVQRFDDFLALAANPNATVMWSGFFHNSTQPYPHEDVHGHLARCLDAYGSQRIMWSADANRPGFGPSQHQEAVRLVTDALPFLTADDVRHILGQTALRVYGFDAQRLT